MTYYCGVEKSVSRSLGAPSGNPRIECDSCGLVFPVVGRGVGAVPPAWFLDGKAPRGWRKTINENGEARHYCSRCKKAPVAISRTCLACHFGMDEGGRSCPRCGSEDVEPPWRPGEEQ